MYTVASECIFRLSNKHNAYKFIKTTNLQPTESPYLHIGIKKRKLPNMWTHCTHPTAMSEIPM